MLRTKEKLMDTLCAARVETEAEQTPRYNDAADDENIVGNLAAAAEETAVV